MCVYIYVYIYVFIYIYFKGCLAQFYLLCGDQVDHARGEALLEQAASHGVALAHVYLAETRVFHQPSRYCQIYSRIKNKTPKERGKTKDSAQICCVEPVFPSPDRWTMRGARLFWSKPHHTGWHSRTCISHMYSYTISSRIYIRILYLVYTLVYDISFIYSYTILALFPHTYVCILYLVCED